ncbi:hypothetical protein Ocin01_10271 [Orchesella cincta]|uniref:Uncharacterized protein n=1 Tax=Orchesella cincta TaxID=48709 RepID=A0A1D2MTQ4_ORCCI|nr:hypothetical protein Ocin01_10271 [Orchesella cincta]
MNPVPDVSSSSLLCPAAKKTAFKVAYGDNEFHPRKTIGKFIIDLNHENDHPCVFTVHFSLNIHGMLSVDKATVDQVVGLHIGETFSIMDLNSDEEMPAGAADLLEVGASTEVPREEHSSIRDVPVDSRPVHGLSRSELEAMILEESRFVALDKLEEERQARRTNLVATMLCMKGVLDGYLKRFVNEEQDRLDEYFTNLEHWLSHEGKNVDGEAFDQKLQDLKEKVDPIKVREALYRYRKTLSDAEEAVKAYRAKRPKYAHNADLDEDDKEQISKSIEETEDWLELEEQYSPPDTFSVINNDEEAQLRSKRIEEQWLICWKNARSILNSWKLT